MTTYSECKARISHLIVDEGDIKKVDESSSKFKTAVELNKYLEKTYGCAGINRESLFFYSEDISSKKPNGTCYTHVAALTENILRLGIVCLASGIVIQFIWWVQYLI